MNYATLGMSAAAIVISGATLIYSKDLRKAGIVNALTDRLESDEPMGSDAMFHSSEVGYALSCMVRNAKQPPHTHMFTKRALRRARTELEIRGYPI